MGAIRAARNKTDFGQGLGGLAARKIIAQVGAHKPMTPDDGQRSLMALSEMIALGLSVKGIDSDIINLEYKRDFLREIKTYYAVVLHSIFHANDYYMKMARNDPKCRGKISDLHCLDCWRRRLINTKAETIIVLELLPAALNGWQLDKLDGYTIQKRDHQVTVYRKM